MSESVKYWSRWAVGVGAALLLALAASIYASSMERVTTVERKVEQVERSTGERLPRIETKLDGLKEAQDKIEKKLDDALRGR